MLIRVPRGVAIVPAHECTLQGTNDNRALHKGVAPHDLMPLPSCSPAANEGVDSPPHDDKDKNTMYTFVPARTTH